MDTINKNLLTKAVSKKLGIKPAVVKSVIELFLDQVRVEYKRGNRIELREFGTFFPYTRKSRIYRTFESKESKKMPTKKMLKFKCSKQLHI